MPFISEAASAIKSRFGFHERSQSDSVPCTPDLLKSVTRDKFSSAHHSLAASAVRRIDDWEEEDTADEIHGSIAPPPPRNRSFEFNEDPSFWHDHNVQVIIRLRPLSSSEVSLQGHSKCVRQESSQAITWTGHPESRFTFDLVADESVSQEQLFKVAGLPMVDNCMGGYNSCMFAYGQTGSGKTHTMLGDIEGGTRRHSVNCGMTPRVFECLFSRIQKEKEVRKEEKLKFACKCSFLEIYNEHILDLLDPSSNNLQIREDAKKGIYVENLKEIEVASARDVIQQLIQGAANRKVASTNMNRASSRSHSVFTCIIESKWESQGVTHHRFARLNLVDLAGSERQKSSGAEGERLKEATNINKSLSTLGLVIMNLVSISNGKSQHVPYRDSKLTFLLQDSLGGNAKTIIIANISPSICSSLETLSTLKFAQRAKFIKNNAIVNEDASGDVIAMRMQIQQLKKEVSRLRGLGNGGAEDLDNNTSYLSIQGSPGPFKWEGLQGSFSPLVSEKRASQKKDYDAALVGAFKRQKDMDITLKAMADENQAATRLAKQRADEIQGLKMRLRFREDGIKRLEAVASGKISAESHLLKEKEEHLKEIEVLQTQVDRNQEVTRFAMENLRLKEEIRRLKSFYEEGEREMMNEQIMVLQNKLLEALDWKLMHEPDVKTEVQGDALDSNKDATMPWNSLINEENEFLRMQAIQNQSEIDTLQKQLNFCLQENEKLEKCANDLLAKLEEERSLRATQEEKEKLELPSLSTDASIINFHGQMELKTMVDAIGAASQREAEAHNKSIILSKENDELYLKLEACNEANNELQKKLKALIEEKNSLIEMYERAASESHYNAEDAGQDDMEVEDNGVLLEFTHKKDNDMGAIVKKLEQQLSEMHEENDKLMGLYEKAMHERDEFKRSLTSESRVLDCPEELVEVGGKYTEEPNSTEEDENLTFYDTEIGSSNLIPVKVLGDLNLAKQKLEKAERKVSDSAKNLVLLGSLEGAFMQFHELWREFESIKQRVQVKEQEVRSLEPLSSEMRERKALTEKRLSALKYSLSCFCQSLGYFEQREARARERLNFSSTYVDQKKEEMERLQVCKGETEVAMGRLQEAELELRNKYTLLKSKFEEEKRRQENEKVLFAIDNIEKVDTGERNWHIGSKATDLLKSEEEKTKLQTEIKLTREKLVQIRVEIDDCRKTSAKMENEIESVQKYIQKGSVSTEEMKVALESVIQEKETLLEMEENGKSEVESMIIEYQQNVFDVDLKEMETKTSEEEIQIELRRLEELRTEKVTVYEKMAKVLEERSSNSCCLSEKLEDDLRNVGACLMEVKTLLLEEEN
ncbi:P-loop containing nucleoside triphosphate hydrolases superfamily protein [Euphorbia peplus]|nr:P-loop containing nucleoside triphosphate hydrolases superfamily protein [Euphorbia peplus]